MPYLIGITGIICAGKSTILAYLAGQGYETIDADQIGHQVLDQDDDLFASLVARFGPEIVDHEGNIDREKLGEIIFEDPQDLAFLEQGAHPKIVDTIVDQLSHLKNKHQLVFIEAAVLFKTPLHKLMNEIWLVEASPAKSLERLMLERHLEAGEATARLSVAFHPDEDDLKACKRIDNSSTLLYTQRQVDQYLQQALQHLAATRQS